MASRRLWPTSPRNVPARGSARQPVSPHGRELSAIGHALAPPGGSARYNVKLTPSQAVGILGERSIAISAASVMAADRERVPACVASPMHPRGTGPTGTDTPHIAFTVATVVVILLTLESGRWLSGKRFRLYHRDLSSSCRAVPLAVTEGAADRGEPADSWAGLNGAHRHRRLPAVDHRAGGRAFRLRAQDQREAHATSSSRRGSRTLAPRVGFEPSNPPVNSRMLCR